MEKPFLSIVLCTYNGEHFLREQLDSLLKQTYPHFEILAVDDASTDSTFEILESYSATGKVNVFRNEKNLGLNRNFESMLRQTTGEYILFCDQDDIWEPDKLETLVGHIDGSLLYYHDSAWMDEKGMLLSKKQSDRFNMPIDPHPLSFVALNCITGHACMFHRSLLECSLLPFPKHVYYDNWLGYIAAANGRVRYIDQCLVRYRVHQSNLTVSRQREKGLKKRIDGKNLGLLYAQLDSFYQSAPTTATYRPFLRKLRDSYRSNGFKSRIYRIFLFLRHFRELTALRKKSSLRKLSFCLKMGYKPLPNIFKHL
jgi:glycosyltransferase involved in cell wall biosynthesis